MAESKGFEPLWRCRLTVFKTAPFDHFGNSPHMQIEKQDAEIGVLFLAEKEGFEPSRQLPQPTPLAGEPLTATWVLLHAMLCCYWMSGDVDPSVSAK